MMVISFADRYGAGEDRRSDLILILIDETLAQGLVGTNPVRMPAQSLLELGNRLVDQAHFLVGNAEVVVALVVLVVDVFGNPLLEPLEHLLKVRLLIAGRRLLLGDHARGLRIFT